MLQKLENAYLMILRVVVIVTAGLLLAGVVFYGLNSFKGFSEPSMDNQPPKVSDKDLINGLITKPSSSEGQANTSEAGADSTAQPENDENQAYYTRAAAAIANFVATHSSGVESLNKEQVVKIIKEQAESNTSPELVTAYASGFAQAVEGALASPSVAMLASQSSAIDVVNNALKSFNEQFDKQLAEKEARYAAEQEKHLQNKAEAMQSLYIAAGAFGMFLLIVFLSIFIRIERNLRNLEGKTILSANQIAR